MHLAPPKVAFNEPCASAMRRTSHRSMGFASFVAYFFDLTIEKRSAFTCVSVWIPYMIPSDFRSWDHNSAIDLNALSSAIEDVRFTSTKSISEREIKPQNSLHGIQLN